MTAPSASTLGPGDAPRVICLADSDSYLKWGASTLDAMPGSWRREQWLITSPIAPSPGQVSAATRRPVRRLTLAAAVTALVRLRPDVVLLASTGPVARAVIDLCALVPWPGGRRPVLITGLPGISVPATERAITFRRGADLFLLHSRRECREFAALAAELDVSMIFSLARLPFLTTATTTTTAITAGPVDPDRPARVVFAAQAKVPPEPEQRRAVLLALAGLPAGQHGVIKVRAVTGEQQTHRELWSYPELWRELVAEGRVAPDAVSFVGGSMAEVLRGASGLATVSSTAALEAVHAGLPIIVLSDFGVSAEMINEVFVGSGCLGTLADLRAGRLRQPNDQWLQDNYFHDEQESDWLVELASLRRRRDRTALDKLTVARLGSRSRLWGGLRLVLPPRVVTRVRRTRRWVIGATGVGGAPGPESAAAGSELAGGPVPRSEHPIADLPDGPGSG